MTVALPFEHVDVNVDVTMNGMILLFIPTTCIRLCLGTIIKERGQR